MSFDPGLSTERDKVRLNTGDTYTAEILSDETLDALLASMTFEPAVRAAARAMIAVISKRPEEIAESGGVSFKWKDRIPVLKDLANGVTPILYGTAQDTGPYSGQIDLEGADLFR